MIELGARSDDWLHEEKSIQPYVIEQFPALDADRFPSLWPESSLRLTLAGVGRFAIRDFWQSNPTPEIPRRESWMSSVIGFFLGRMQHR